MQVATTSLSLLLFLAAGCQEPTASSTALFSRHSETEPIAVIDVAHVTRGDTLYLLAADRHESLGEDCAIRYRNIDSGDDAGVYVREDGRIHDLDGGGTTRELASAAFVDANSESHDAKVRRVPSTAVVRGHTHPRARAYSVALSVDEKGEASGDNKGRVRVTYDHRSRTITNAHETPVDSLAFTGTKGWRLAVASSNGNAVRLYDARDGDLLTRCCTSVNKVNDVACSSVSGLIAAGGYDGIVELYDSDEEKSVWVVEVGDQVTAVCFTPDGKYVAYAFGASSSARSYVHFRRTDASGGDATAAELAANHGRIHGLSFRPDGTKFATCGSDALVIVHSTPEFP